MTIRAPLAAAAALVLVVALVPAVSAERTPYVTAVVSPAWCLEPCTEFGEGGLVIFEIPNGADSVDIDVQDELDDYGFRQQASYSYRDAYDNFAGGDSFCDNTTASIPGNAATLRVAVWSTVSSTNPITVDSCPEVDGASKGEVVANFS